MVSEGSSSKKVCVIGAGPSGIVAARELRKEAHNVVVLEQNHDVGGQWLYDPDVVKGHPMGQERFLEVHSSIYASLRVISPREIMGYTDLPFVVKADRDGRRFPGHREVLLYLQDFCERFKLREMIRFNTRVVSTKMLDYPVATNNLKWLVKSTAADKVVEEVYDAVVVATGHYSKPRLPKIEGMNYWKRRQIHSHVYRVPDPFKNEVVVVVGSSYSGLDISMELVNMAKEIYLSSKTLYISEGFSKIISKYDNLHLRPQIESLREDGKVLFIDGTWTIADTIIYCTGYSYTLLFLDTKGIVGIDDDRVGPLYEHMFPPLLAPSLSFIGIPRRVIGFPLFEAQAKWIGQLLSGKKRLPSLDDMMQSIKEFYHMLDVSCIPKHETHLMIKGFEYMDQIADYTDFLHLEEWRKTLCLSTARRAEINLKTYRDSYDDDEEMMQVAFNSLHFKQFELEEEQKPQEDSKLACEELIADEVLREVVDQTTTFGLWNKLCEKYRNNSLTNRLYQKQRFYTLWMSESTQWNETVKLGDDGVLAIKRNGTVQIKLYDGTSRGCESIAGTKDCGADQMVEFETPDRVVLKEEQQDNTIDQSDQPERKSSRIILLINPINQIIQNFKGNWLRRKLMTLLVMILALMSQRHIKKLWGPKHFQRATSPTPFARSQRCLFREQVREKLMVNQGNVAAASTVVPTFQTVAGTSSNSATSTSSLHIPTVVPAAVPHALTPTEEQLMRALSSIQQGMAGLQAHLVQVEQAQAAQGAFIASQAAQVVNTATIPATITPPPPPTVEPYQRAEGHRAADRPFAEVPMDVHYQSLLDHTSSAPRGSGNYENFNRIAATSKSHGITEDVAKLILFPFSLSGEARKWFDNLYPIPGSFKEVA
ncbi:flavin-containing monooxygenase FMO GS-OX-like 9 [Andrographis paniculata]|uniref:flavin-containing monooxygenase FMO GS-OX-like 9 n=1 Tax=Andrographis paniculata TaxID=175694 RepID=UPI0021E6E98F|nr:flavin-containing monooxygenase FMO GS-OX-like 9 [Andrographis paniculata]